MECFEIMFDAAISKPSLEPVHQLTNDNGENDCLPSSRLQPVLQTVARNQLHVEDRYRGDDRASMRYHSNVSRVGDSVLMNMVHRCCVVFVLPPTRHDHEIIARSHIPSYIAGRDEFVLSE